MRRPDSFLVASILVFVTCCGRTGLHMVIAEGGSTMPIGGAADAGVGASGGPGGISGTGEMGG